jgi:hypothetical protein
MNKTSIGKRAGIVGWEVVGVYRYDLYRQESRHRRVGGSCSSAHGGFCRADGGSGGFCRGWQLVAEVANEKNALFFPGAPLIYEFCLRMPGDS